MFNATAVISFIALCYSTA